jgi:hypothetical protein
VRYRAVSSLAVGIAAIALAGCSATSTPPGPAGHIGAGGAHLVRTGHAAARAGHGG